MDNIKSLLYGSWVIPNSDAGTRASPAMNSSSTTSSIDK